MNQPEVIAADPKLRRLALLTVLAALAIGGVAIGWFLPWLTEALAQARLSGTLNVPLACYLFLAVVTLLAAGVVAFGVYGVRFGRSVLATGQYPPPGTRVVRDTRIQRGPVAAFTGKGQVVLGALLVFLGLLLFALGVWGTLMIARAAQPNQVVEPGAPSEQPYATRTVLFIQAGDGEIERARAGVPEEDFYVMADDLMYYRATAREHLETQGITIQTLSGRRALAFRVQGTTRSYDFAEAPTLDLIVVYHPEREPRTFAPIDVGEAVSYFQTGG